MDGDTYDVECGSCRHEWEIPDDSFSPPDECICPGCGASIELCLDGGTAGGFYWVNDGWTLEPPGAER